MSRLPAHHPLTGYGPWHFLHIDNISHLVPHYSVLGSHFQVFLATITFSLKQLTSAGASIIPYLSLTKRCQLGMSYTCSLPYWSYRHFHPPQLGFCLRPPSPSLQFFFLLHFWRVSYAYIHHFGFLATLLSLQFPAVHLAHTFTVPTYIPHCFLSGLFSFPDTYIYFPCLHFLSLSLSCHQSIFRSYSLPSVSLIAYCTFDACIHQFRVLVSAFFHSYFSTSALTLFPTVHYLCTHLFVVLALLSSISPLPFNLCCCFSPLSLHHALEKVKDGAPWSRGTACSCFLLTAGSPGSNPALHHFQTQLRHWEFLTLARAQRDNYYSILWKGVGKSLGDYQA